MAITTVGAYEAKTHLPRLLAEVEAGGEVVITRHGHPVARLVPIRPAVYDIAELIEEMNSLRESLDPLGVSVRDLIEEGRRF